MMTIANCLEAGSEKIQLTQDGSTDCRIMLGADATEIEKFAAQELQGYVMQISGAFLPMANRNEQAFGKLIFVGRSALARLGLDVDEDYLGTDGFAIKTIGDNIVMAGATPRGTLYSVYAFLEGIGCRWFAPGIIGEVIPHQPSIVIPSMDYSERPSFEYRGFISTFSVAYGNAQWIDWMAKNRLNCLMMDLSKYNDFKKIMGGELERRGMYVGVTSDNFDIVDFVNNNPEVDIIALRVGDLKSASAEETPDEQYLEAITRTAQLIHKNHPDKLFFLEGKSTQLSNVSQNNSFSFEPIPRCYRHSLDDEQCEINYECKTYLEELLKTHGEVHIYENYMGPYEQNSLPFPILQTIASDMKYFDSLGAPLNGIISQCEVGNWGTYGLNYYVFSRMAWKAYYDLGSIVDDYCEKYYSSASSPMKSYFAVLEDAMAKMEHFQYINPPELITKLLNEDALKKLKFHIQNAKALSDDAMVFDRIRKIQLSLDHTSFLWNMLDYYSKALQLLSGDRDGAKEYFQKAIEQGEKLVAFLFQNVDEGVFIITEDYIFNYLEPIIADAQSRKDLLSE